MAAPALVFDSCRARCRNGRNEPSARVLARRRQAGAGVSENREACRESRTLERAGRATETSMTEAKNYPYATYLDIKFAPLSVVNVPALVAACNERWYNQTLCKVNDS